jgi:low molecular weight protein-tyrosine phosphatase
MEVPIRVLFVCMGNICRSPTAEGVFRHQVEQAGLSHLIHVDSAGTIDYHAGDAPDRRARVAAARRGYDLSALRARQVTPQDFETFHYLLAMDLDNLAYLHRVSPEEHRPKARLFLEFSSNASVREVPDPYYGPAGGFEHVLDLTEDASRGLLAYIKQQLNTSSSR